MTKEIYMFIQHRKRRYNTKGKIFVETLSFEACLLMKQVAIKPCNKVKLKTFKFLGFKAIISKLEVGNILVIYKNERAYQTYMRTKKCFKIHSIKTL